MLRVVGVGHAYGDVIIDNKFIEALDVGTTEAWILEKIGIKERSVTLPLDYISQTKNKNPYDTLKVRTKTWIDLADEAIRMAAKRAEIDLNEIGMLLLDCITPDFFFPPPSVQLKEKLGIDCLAVDCITACPAVALHGYLCLNFNLEDLPENICCVTSATVSHTVNYSDRTDGAIWGDGAAAMIVTKKEKKGLKIIHSSFDSDPTRAASVLIEREGYFRQDGRAVRNFSVLQTVRMIKDVKNQCDLDFSRDIFIGHQANKTMLDQICQACGIPEKNHWSNVVYRGNQAAAGALASLSENWEEIQYHGQKILIAVLGAGLSWGTLLLES